MNRRTSLAKDQLSFKLIINAGNSFILICYWCIIDSSLCMLHTT